MRAILLLLVAWAAGCAPGGVPRCDAEPDNLGDQPEAAVLVAGPDGAIRDARDGESLPMIRVPGGGRVLLVSARARHLRAGKGRIRVVFWDEDRQTTLSVDEREVDLESGQDCWLRPRFSSSFELNNVPACPIIYFGPPVGKAVLSVTVSDDEGIAADARVHVIATCAADDAGCECECAPNARLGSCH